MLRFTTMKLPVLVLAITTASGIAYGQPALPLSTIENTEVDQFISSRYLSTDVKHSFSTALGDVIDCIDFYAQPSVKLLLAQGTEVFPPTGLGLQTLVAAKTGAKSPTTSGSVSSPFDGSKDEKQNVRACSPPLVPMLRITAADIKASGGLDSFLAGSSQKIATPTPPEMGLPYYAHVYERSNATAITFMTTTVNVMPSLLLRTPDHDISQLWLLSSGQKESIEMGVHVGPQQYGNSINPHLFIFSTTNNYGHASGGHTGCYNNIGSGCVPFVVTPGATYTPGITLSGSSIATSSSELVLAVSLQTTSPAGWYLFAGPTLATASAIGYYPVSDFSLMSSSAEAAEVGGEVFDSTNQWVTTMGFGGTSASSPELSTAYQRNFWVVAPGACNFSDSQSCWNAVGSTVPSAYAFITDPSPPSGWTVNFMYANAPQSFWGQNTDQSGGHFGDWASGRYKGTCPAGRAVTGISKFTDSHASHAFRCSPGSNGDSAVNSSYCHTALVAQQDVRGAYRITDWDSGFYKTECTTDEYVAGVSQTTSGVIDKVYCCKTGTDLHGNNPTVDVGCYVEQLGAAGSFGPPNVFDWDVGFYKGRCSRTDYDWAVVGVSNPPPWNGTPGSPHSILCCHR